MLNTITDLTNPRVAAAWLTALVFVINAMLLGQPDEPVTMGSIVTVALMSALAVAGLAWAYRGDKIAKWYRLMRYNRVTRHYL